MLGNKIDVSGALSEADLGTIFALNERTTGTVSRRSICIIYKYYRYIYIILYIIISHVILCTCIYMYYIDILAVKGARN